MAVLYARIRLVIGLALAISSGAALAQGSMAGTGPIPAAGAAAADPLARKCRGLPRLTCRAATRVSDTWQIPAFEMPTEAPPTETLADALEDAYRQAPSLQSRRYQLRASDEDYAIARAETRPTTQVQVAGSYTETVPGRITAAQQPFPTGKTLTSTLSAEAILTQPLLTGGKAAADTDAALAEASAGRAQLRGTEGDILQQVITAYLDIRRDTQSLRLYEANARKLEAILAEVNARRGAGEMTLTDVAQAETQVQFARSQANVAAQQLEQDRATFAMLTGRDAGVLAPPPPLPHVPDTVDAALAIADENNPELAGAIATERETRAQIAAARAQGRPTLSLYGTAQIIGHSSPLFFPNDDRTYQGQLVLTIPLTNGGRVGALVGQAQDRDASARVGIEDARRQMVDRILNAWNAMATAQRNIVIGNQAVAASDVFNDGTFKEYRAGLRTTYDVLYAQSTQLSARVALLAAEHDVYVAEAGLLRGIGALEARMLLSGTALYDPAANLRHAEARGATPLDPLVHAIDRAEEPAATGQPLEHPPTGDGAPRLPAATPPAEANPASHFPMIPAPGSTGRDSAARSLTQP